jgi:MSHA biogenesis protein MshO
MTHKRISGFTLIELIMTIVLLGIIGGVLAPVIQNSVAIYAAERSRAALVQKGRLALERIAREVREAVPNSLSVINDGAGNPTGIEFLQISSGGRYIDLIDNFGLTAFTDPLKKFDSSVAMTQLYSLGTGQTATPGDLLIIGNVSPANLIAGTTVVSLANPSVTPTVPGIDGATTTGEILNFAPFTFPGGSPGRRYFIANTNYEIGLLAGTIRWHTGAGLTGYDTGMDWVATDPILVDGVTVLTFTFSPGAATGVAVLSMTLSLTDGSETITLYQEVQIRNAM